MNYIKATEADCLAYDAEVTVGENYTGGTIRWAEPIEIDGYHYMIVHDRYPTTLTTVTELPVIDDEII
tara:strand:- start:1291 stop:1494 length:204 start_codon:yes stop_codon:yes gene_type:complete